MSILMDIIEEEKERLEKLLIFYKQEIEKLPNGYISKKKVNGNIYCYRSFRDKKNVRTIYIGSEFSEAAKDMGNKILERKKLEELYKKTKKNLAEAKRALHGKK